MASLEKLNLAETQNVVNRFRNLFYHRTVILEGIRKIAFRNMIHLTEAIEYVESKTDSIDESQWIDRIQRKMLSDQGLEDSELNKTLIEWATFCPLQVYLALLYAEIEFYMKFCMDIDVLSDDVFNEHLNKQTEFVSKLSKFRDFYLHPAEENIPGELNFLKVEGSYNHAPGLQRHLDEYLTRTRLKILRRLKSVLFSLPEIERLECTWLFLQKNFKRMEDHEDVSGMEHVGGQFETLHKQIAKVPEDVKSRLPGQRQVKAALALAELLNEVSPSGPEQQLTNLEAKQTGMTMLMLSPLVSEQAVTSYGNTRTASHVKRNVDALKRIIITSGVLLNEGVTVQGTYTPERLQELAKTMSREDFIESFRDTFSSQGLQSANEHASLGRVSTALLYEPLRLYSVIERENPQIAREQLRDWTSQSNLRNLNIYRNSVFHVLEPRQHPLEVDLSILDPDFLSNDNGRLYSNLAAFFGFVKQDEAG